MIKSFQPQLATLSHNVPTSDEWLHETKWDGYRLIADKTDSAIRLLTRNGIDWTHKFPLLGEELQVLPQHVKQISNSRKSHSLSEQSLRCGI